MRVVCGYSPSIPELGLRNPLPGRSDDILCYGTGEPAALRWDPAANSYLELAAQYPKDWQPDVFSCPSLEYHPTPTGLEVADCLTVATVGDWNLGAQVAHMVGGMFDMLFADKNGGDRLRAAGFPNVRSAPLWAFDPNLHRLLPDTERDLDIVLIGSFNPNVQRERMRWIGRVAGLSGKYRVCLTSGVYGEEYTRLMNRAKIVFNRSIRGEINMRVYEAAACGALLFYERENREIGDLFTDRQECVLYSDDDLEDLLDYYLASENAAERERIAEAGRRVVQTHSWSHHAATTLATLEADFATLKANAHRPFFALPPVEQFFRRAYHLLTLKTPPLLGQADHLLLQAERLLPARADIANARACVFAELARYQPEAALRTSALRQAARCAERALSLCPDYAVAWFNLAQIRLELGDTNASETLQAALHSLHAAGLRAEQLKGPYYPRRFDTPFIAELEKVWAEHLPESPEWVEAMRELLLWRASELAADLAFARGDLFVSAKLAGDASGLRPEIGVTRGRLADALTRLGRRDEAEAEYRRALEDAPLCTEMWEALANLLLDAKRLDACRVFLDERRDILNGCPPLEAWRPTLETLTAALDTAAHTDTSRPPLRLLALPDWNEADQWQPLLQSYVRQFAPGDPITLMLHAEPAQVEQIIAAMEGYLKSTLRVTLDDIPDVTLLTDLPDGTPPDSLYEQADALVLVNAREPLAPQVVGLPTLRLADLSRALLPA